MPGRFFLTITRARGSTAGVRTACSAFATAIAGFASRRHFGMASDPILKERFFGLSNPQGNHGEDLKEYFYHLDNTPTHSFMRALYKYPQQEFPYQRLIEESARRTRLEPEFELVDTGIFDEGRYFDIFIEYAKAAPNDICIRVCHGQSRARTRAADDPAYALVSKHLVLGSGGKHQAANASHQ